MCLKNSNCIMVSQLESAFTKWASSKNGILMAPYTIYGCSNTHNHHMECDVFQKLNLCGGSIYKAETNINIAFLFINFLKLTLLISRAAFWVGLISLVGGFFNMGAFTNSCNECLSQTDTFPACQIRYVF